MPKHLVGFAGTTSWKKSLGTTDKSLAAIKRANLTAFYKAEIVRLEGMLAGAETQVARDLVDRALELFAARKGSLGPVIRAFLTFITLRGRQSWSRDHEREARWDFGLVFFEADDDDEELDEASDPLPGFDTDEERDAFVTRHRLLEHRGMQNRVGGRVHMVAAQRANVRAALCQLVKGRAAAQLFRTSPASISVDSAR